MNTICLRTSEVGPETTVPGASSSHERIDVIFKCFFFLILEFPNIKVKQFLSNVPLGAITTPKESGFYFKLKDIVGLTGTMFIRFMAESWRELFLQHLGGSSQHRFFFTGEFTCQQRKEQPRYWPCGYLSLRPPMSWHGNPSYVILQLNQIYIYSYRLPSWQFIRNTWLKLMQSIMFSLMRVWFTILLHCML